ncbi:MAG TPA: hypothetical protein VED40_09075 [Azospirillaceae bacterium]|nr:hypothetical protein [Azospirillaceae bacterium]
MRTALMAMGLMMLAGGALADPVDDAARDGMALYEAGDRAGAAARFEEAARLIRQAKADRLARALPDPLPGWTAEEPAAEAALAGVLGGGVAAGRAYRGEEGAMELSLITDSPLIAQAAAEIRNPTRLKASGAHLEKIAGRDAVVRYDPDARSGEITLPVEDQALVTLTGVEVTREELVAQMALVDPRRFVE